MIYVTGDLHGQEERLKSKGFKSLKKGDTLLVAGDFGFVWNGSKEEKKRLHAMGKKKQNILFVPGTNDNYDLLREYPLEDAFGGKVRRISGNVAMLVNGEVYEIEGKTFFAMGGGTTDDTVIDLQEGVNWWKDEEPGEDEFSHGLQSLEKYDMTVDYILTHDVSAGIRSFLLMDHSEQSNLNYYLDQLAKRVKFTRWYFGCYHLDRAVTPSYTAVYQEVLPVNPDPTKGKKKKK